MPEKLRKGDVLEQILKAYFTQILKVDYETIFTTEFIDEIAFPEDEKAVESIRDLINEISRHRISTISYEFMGNLFENLIPDKDRHLLGQYFTNSDVVDLILKFCLTSEHDFVLDPGCGAGTFLVRAYGHKKLMNPRLKHEEILPTIWGIDISKFASHLSTINLAIKDLSVGENYPRVAHSDFFEVNPPSVSQTGIHFGIPKPAKAKIKSLGVEEKEIEYPERFDCVVGDPPYTRQEEIERLAKRGYKGNLIELALSVNNNKLAQLSKRAGIHAYFFVHGYKFLKTGGRFGFVVSNSWLDVDWGSGLQEFFLKHYKIMAIIESKVERWFVDADVNTCIVILERTDKAEERDKNVVRFVQLKKPLRHFIPNAEKDWDKEVKRLQEIDKLVKLILAHTDYYENEEIRIYPKTQPDLWNEGYDKDSQKYTGAKWGKYIRAPAIFFKIMDKVKDLFVPLKEVADVRFGIKTGANEFFYLTEEEIEAWGIEEVLMIHKDKKELEGTNVLKYIEYGESKGFHERPTCKSRIEKAKSVSRNNKNKKKFSEVDLLVKRTLDSLGDENILKNFFDGMGEYEEMILPRFRKEAKIEKTLTGWQLTDGKERVFFDDKKQAVYCGILAFMGMEKVKIPKELDEKKVNALRNIVDSVFQAINATLETVTDKKRRDVVKSLVIGRIIARTNEAGAFV